jgi:TIR domain
LTTSSRIFVTHSSHDQALAKALVDCIRRGLSLDNDSIFCSSVSRHGIPTGLAFVSYIRDKLGGTGLLIPIVTPAYLDSLFCMWELGAAWIQKTPVYPLLVDPVSANDLPLLLSGLEAKQIDQGLNALAERCAATIGVRIDRDTWRRAKQGFLADLPKATLEIKTGWATTPRSVERRRARVGAVASRIHHVHHLLRDITHTLFHPNTAANVMQQSLFWDSLTSVLDEMAAVFSELTGEACRMVIKQHVSDLANVEVGSESVGSSALVRDFVRSSNSHSVSPRFDRIQDNTDFREIYNGERNVYRCNDIAAAISEGGYENSHLAIDKPLPYSSTIVWPIRKMLPAAGGERRQDLLGFLCVDSPTVDTFDDTDVQIGASFADALYVLRPCLL